MLASYRCSVGGMRRSLSATLTGGRGQVRTWRARALEPWGDLGEPEGLRNQRQGRRVRGERWSHRGGARTQCSEEVPKNHCGSHGESQGQAPLYRISHFAEFSYSLCSSTPQYMRVIPSLIHAKGQMESAFVGWKLDCGWGGGGGEVTKKPRHPGFVNSEALLYPPSLRPWVLRRYSRSKFPVCQMLLFPLSLPL